jgi:hypothetical protein
MAFQKVLKDALPRGGLGVSSCKDNATALVFVDPYCCVNSIAVPFESQIHDDQEREGSFRRTAEKLKVTMQLIQGSTDRHLMVAEIEEQTSDPVNLQAAIASRLRDELGGMTGVLRRESIKIALAKRSSELTEYDYYVLGQLVTLNKSRGEPWKLMGETEQGQKASAAQDLWEKGVKRFPQSVLLHCEMGFYHLDTSDYALFQKQVDEARKLKKRSPLDEWCLHWASAWLEATWTGDMQRAVAEAQATVAMAPYDTLCRIDLSQIMLWVRRKNDAVAWSTYGMTHDPNPRRWYAKVLIQAYKAAGKWTELAELAERELKSNPNSKPWYEVLWEAYTWTGETEKAAEAERMVRNIPDPPQD